MLKRFTCLISTVILLGGFAMTLGAEAHDAKVNESMLVSTAWLADHLDDADLVIVCVASDPGFYDGGHIPGARYIPLNRLVSQGATLNAIPPVAGLKELFESVGVDKHSRIVIYGERQGMLAARAYVTLDYLGLADRAALLDGGMEKWRAEHRAETTDSAKIKFTSLDFHLRPEVLERFEGVQKHVLSGDATLVDARPIEEFSGKKRSEDVPVSGHIKGASGLYWQELLTSKEIPTFRPPAELLAAYTAAGARPGREVISYCRTGMQASVDYFVAKYLGFPSRIYVSSFFEWSRRAGPVEKSVQHADAK
jgi:thiosulfate/3-mercaptopyruvate sulfurtransferase